VATDRRKKSAKPTTKRGRGNPQGPPKRGRRGHPVVDQQPGFSEWLKNQLLEEPKPTYDDIADRLKSTGFYASRSALARWGIKFECRRAEMQILLEQAEVLAQEDPERILQLEKATSNLGMTKLLSYLQDPEKQKLGEDVLGAIFAAARLQSSSASRERAQAIANGKFRTAMNAMRRALENKLLGKPELAKELLQILEKAHAEVSR
jgi:hypothetical protein